MSMEDALRFLQEEVIPKGDPDCLDFKTVDAALSDWKKYALKLRRRIQGPAHSVQR